MFKSKLGSPSKIDNLLTNKILKLIENHVPYKIAAESNGISERTFYNWLNQGIKDMEECNNSEFAQFLQSLREIEADRIRMHIINIREGGDQLKGSQWILERVFWKHFSSYVIDKELNERVEALERQKGDVNADSSKEEKE